MPHKETLVSCYQINLILRTKVRTILHTHTHTHMVLLQLTAFLIKHANKDRGGTSVPLGSTATAYFHLGVLICKQALS